jgi:hypothetical protein
MSDEGRIDPGVDDDLRLGPADYGFRMDTPVS